MACITGKKVISSTSNKEQIRFGHGGGFTGAVTEYCLKENGELYKKALGDISKMSAMQKEIDQCFTKCEAIKFRKIILDSPGNRYVFISHHRNDSIHRVTWNPYQPKLSPKLVEFHNMLLALVGEEPMTILPDESLDIERDKVRKKEFLEKVKLKKKSAVPNTKNALNKKDLKTVKHKKLQKLKKSKM